MAAKRRIQTGWKLVPVQSGIVTKPEVNPILQFLPPDSIYVHGSALDGGRS